MCAYSSLTRLSEQDEADGWEVADRGSDFSVLVKKWQQTVMTSDGRSRMKGQQKKVSAIEREMLTYTVRVKSLVKSVIFHCIV